LIIYDLIPNVVDEELEEVVVVHHQLSVLDP
jgi:hypothetical protein